MMWSRRSWIASCLTTSLLGAKNRIDLSRVSVITDEVARTAEDAVAFAKQYGLRWVELRQVPGKRAEYAFLSEEEVRTTAQLLDRHGLRVSFLNTSLLKVMIPGLEPARWSKDDGERRLARMKADQTRFERRFEDLQKAIRAAKILGVDKVRVFTGWRTPDPMAALPRVAEVIRELAAVAGSEKIHLLVENEVACNVGTCAELAALFKLIPSPWVGINWDPHNGSAHQENPFPDGYRLLPKKRIWNVQIKGKSILNYPGKLDWKSIFRALQEDGYPGQVGLETHIFGDGQIQASHDSMRELLRLLA
ncbi:MAG: sugar phosphate isomerase/epimerase [Bryobacteraceae bacterium]|nr:sugar phosphate isomerase/epimerase [Bryobacteraceae bacterium]MDW8378775.1 sugar phosphate isomerase/epimerase family protein [Bryobacterales bacterium]